MSNIFINCILLSLLFLDMDATTDFTPERGTFA